MLELKNISKKFESPALKDLNASFEKGRIHLLQGRNASGKTTLLKIIAGCLSPDSGEISLGGKALPSRNYPFNSFSLAFVEGRFYEQISAAENIKFRLRLRGLSLKKEELLAGAERLGLGEKELAEIPAGLSLGTRQKVSMLGALLSKSEILLLDEAFAVLDLPARERLAKTLREEAASGRTVIFSSQTARGLETFSDRFHILKDGALLSPETPSYD